MYPIQGISTRQALDFNGYESKNGNSCFPPASVRTGVRKDHLLAICRSYFSLSDFCMLMLCEKFYVLFSLSVLNFRPKY